MGRAQFKSRGVTPPPCSCAGPLVVVPQPPALDLAPQSARAVVTVAVGEVGQDLLAASGAHMRAYAKRLGADFVVLDWPGHPAWPISAKFAIARTLEHYSRVAYVDADVLLRPGCVDLFAACHADEIGFVDELWVHRASPQFGLENAYRRFRAEMGFSTVELAWLMNAGVMCIPASAKDLFLPPTVPIKIGHLSEQHWVDSRIRDSGHPYRTLDRRSNWQAWHSPVFRDAPPDAVLHFSGCRGSGRATRIQEWAERFPVGDTIRGTKERSI